MDEHFAEQAHQIQTAIAREDAARAGRMAANALDVARERLVAFGFGPEFIGAIERFEATVRTNERAGTTAPATTNPSVTTDRVLQEVLAERIAQDAKWGEQNHPDGTGGYEARQLAEHARRECQAAAALGIVTWLHISDEEHCEALAESDPVKLRAELVQDAAVKVAWIEAIDRRSVKEPS